MLVGCLHALEHYLTALICLSTRCLRSSTSEKSEFPLSPSRSPSRPARSCSHSARDSSSSSRTSSSLRWYEEICQSYQMHMTSKKKKKILYVK